MVGFYGQKWQIDNVEAVLFDKDGTFINSHIYWGEIIKRRSHALLDYLNLNQNIFSEICLKMGYDIDKQVLIKQGPIALVSREEVINELCNYFHSCNVNVNFSEIDSLFIKVHDEFLKDIDAYIQLIPGCLEIFELLKKHSIKMAVVTTDTESNTKHTLESLNLSDYFKVIVGKGHTKEPKKTGVPALKAIQELDCKICNTICIGDSPMDLEMASNARCKAGIGIASGQLPIETLIQYSPYVVDKITDIRVIKE